MNKLITKIFLGVFTVFLITGTAFAANSTSIRLQQPDSPTNNSQFNITFVVLDTNASQPVSVQCYKKGPTDAGYVAFGSVINLTNGGNTDNCQVDGIMNQGSGTYNFEAIATGSTTPTSNVVSVNFNNSEGPGAPENYNKTKPDNCTYKITFKTANDSGKTVKVSLYRSSDTAFNVDSGHQVNSINIGSDTDSSMTDNISPNCDTNYYYAIRAFDIYGNGSDVRGDSNTTTTTVNTTTTTSTEQGAIPVAGQGGSVLGEKTGTATEAAKEVLGETKAIETVALPNSASSATSWIMSHKKISLLILIIIAGTAFSLYRRFQKRVK